MPVSIRLGRVLEDRLTRASRKLRVNKTQVIKRGLEVYLAQIEPGHTPYELGKDLFGADESRAINLSSDYKRRLKRKLRARHHR